MTCYLIVTFFFINDKNLTLLKFIVKFEFFSICCIYLDSFLTCKINDDLETCNLEVRIFEEFLTNLK